MKKKFAKFVKKLTGKGTGEPSKEDLKRKEEADDKGEGFIFLDDKYWLSDQAKKDKDTVDSVRSAKAGKKKKK